MQIHKTLTRFTPNGSGVDRSAEPGTVHLTDVMRYIAQTLKLKGVYGSDSTSHWELDVAAEAGFIWEDVLSRAYAERCVPRPPEQQKGVIVFSPDGFGFDPGVWDYGNDCWLIEPSNEPVLEEYKCTWQSVKKSPLDVWRYKVQAQGYLYGMGLRTVIYRILHLNGDYAGSGPLYKQVRISYNEDIDQLELENNWAMLELNAHAMLEKGYNGNVDAVL